MIHNVLFAYIIPFLILIVTSFILHDTHIKIYWKFGREFSFVEEYDFDLYVWEIIIIAMLSFIPILNIFLFFIFSITYLVHAAWNPRKCTGYTHVFRLRGNNIFTKLMLLVCKFLCKKL